MPPSHPVGFRSTPPTTTPLIIDTDIGDDPDDTVALVIAARTEPRLALVVTSDEREGARARFARQLLDLLGRSDVAVTAGLQVSREGPADLCVRDLIDERVANQPADVLGAVASVVEQTDGPVRWVGLGFLSNLAMLCERRPDLARRLVVTQMGGALDREPRRPEYNFGGDPPAARAALARIQQPHLVIADLTYQEPMRVLPDSALCSALDTAARGSWQRVVGEQFRAWFAIPKPSFQHDPLALSAALGRRFVAFDGAQVTLDRTGRMALAANGHDVRLARTVDYEAFMRWLHIGLGVPQSAAGRGGST